MKDSFFPISHTFRGLSASVLARYNGYTAKILLDEKSIKVVNVGSDELKSKFKVVKSKSDLCTKPKPWI